MSTATWSTPFHFVLRGSLVSEAEAVVSRPRSQLNSNFYWQSGSPEAGLKTYKYRRTQSDHIIIQYNKNINKFTEHQLQGGISVRNT